MVNDTLLHPCKQESAHEGEIPLDFERGKKKEKKKLHASFWFNVSRGLKLCCKRLRYLFLMCWNGSLPSEVCGKEPEKNKL